MKTAEHSLQKHRASQGASPPPIPMTSSFVTISRPAPASKSLLTHSSWRRSRASGCALVAVLALGCVAIDHSNAHAAPPRVKNSIQASVARPFKLPVAVPERILSLPATPPLTAIAESTSARIPRAPRAALMPRATAFQAPLFPDSEPQVVKPRAPRQVAPRSMQSIAQSVTSRQGGGKMIRLAQNSRPAMSNATVAATFPATRVQMVSTVPPVALRPAAPAMLRPVLGGMKKVISVPSLSLPPLSKPLPRWMQNAAVKVDRLDKKPARLAQNPLAPPVRNPAVPVTNSDRLPNQIEVAVSTFVVLLTTTDLQTVAVADPGIADVAVVNSRSVLLNGKSAGVTSLVIVDGQKIRQYTVRVTAAPGSRPVDVASAIGLPGVSVRSLRDTLILEGEVANAEEARRAIEIAGIYAPKVINQLTIRGQISQEAGNAAQLRDLINLPNVNVRVVGDTAVLSGIVDTPQQIQDADVIARAISKNVINQLRLPALTSEQVRQSLSAVAEAPIGSSIAGPTPPGVFAAPSPLIVREAGGSLILEGSTDSQAAYDQIVALATRTGLPLVNRLQVPAALSTDQGVLASIAQAIGRPGVRVSGTAKRLVLEGLVANTEEAVAVEQIARAYAAQVDNMLQTPNPRLVDVDVSIVEITRTGIKNLGFTFPSLLDSSGTGFVFGQRSTGADTPGPLPVPGTGSFQQQNAFQAALRAEIQNQNVRLLSNPRTTVLSGRTATFQVGGQVPVPVSITQSATGTITGIAFKDFGVLVDVVPNASANGAVTMRVKTEISQPDTSIGFSPTPGAGIIPGFQRRAATTEVTTSPGGTIALGGLISTDARTLISRVPVLSRIPILGSLFTSKRFQNNQTELVIFVTPRLLPNPLPAGTTAAAGVVSVGNTTNASAILGNPGLNTGGISGGAPAQ